MQQACLYRIYLAYGFGIDSLDRVVGVIRKRAFTFFFIPDDFQGFRVHAPGMRPASGDCQAGCFFIQGMVRLVAVCDTYPLETYR